MKNLIFADIIPNIIILSVCSYIYKRFTQISVKEMILLIVLSYLIITTPYLQVTHSIYSQLVIFMANILFIVVIFLSTLPLLTRILISICILLIYRKNLSILYNINITFCRVINIPPSVKRDDSLLGKEIYNIYQKNGIRIVTNFEKLPKNPTIILANYVNDRLENTFCILIPRKLSILMQSSFKNLNMNNIIYNPVYVSGVGKGNTKYVSKEVKKSIEEGNDFFCYINNPGYYDYLSRPKKGMFIIAMEHNISVTPITFDKIDTIFGCIPCQNYFIKVGDTFYVDNITTSRNKVTRFYRESFKEFNKEKYNFNFHLI